MGFPKIAPPPNSEPVVLSRDVLRRGQRFGVSSLPLTRGPPLPFLTTPTVYSDWILAGLLHPASGHGVHHVSGPLPTVFALTCCHALTTSSGMLAFPVMPYPAELSPRHQLCAASPQPIPPRRYLRLPSAALTCRHVRMAPFRCRRDLEVLFRCRVRCCTRCCHRVPLDAPLGLFPSMQLSRGGCAVPGPEGPGPAWLPLQAPERTRSGGSAGRAAGFSPPDSRAAPKSCALTRWRSAGLAAP
jgi:hypothetical protein